LSNEITSVTLKSALFVPVFNLFLFVMPLGVSLSMLKRQLNPTEDWLAVAGCASVLSMWGGGSSKVCLYLWHDSQLTQERLANTIIYNLSTTSLFFVPP